MKEFLCLSSFWLITPTTSQKRKKNAPLLLTNALIDRWLYFKSFANSSKQIYIFLLLILGYFHKNLNKTEVNSSGGVNIRFEEAYLYLADWSQLCGFYFHVHSICKRTVMFLPAKQQKAEFPTAKPQCTEKNKSW